MGVGEGEDEEEGSEDSDENSSEMAVLNCRSHSWRLEGGLDKKF